MSEREKQKLQVWSQIMPYKESFAWAMVSLFDNNAGAASVGPASPSSPLAPSVSGSSSHEGVFESSAKISLDGKLGYTSGNSVIVEISNLNKAKESYTEESLLVSAQDTNDSVLIDGDLVFILSTKKLISNSGFCWTLDEVF